MSIKAVVFDLFGTLIHLEQARNPYRIVFDAAMRQGRDKNEVKADVLSRNISEMDDLAATFGLTEEETGQFLSELTSQLAGASLYFDALLLFKDLRSRGYRTGVISNLATPYKVFFYVLQLDDWIDEVVFSCDEGCVKPDSAIYEIMRLRMGLPFEEMLMIGDSARCDVIGPRAVGMNAILLDRQSPSDPLRRVQCLDEALHIIEGKGDLFHV